MGKAGAIKQGRAFVELFCDDSKLVRGLRKAEGSVKAFGNAVSAPGRGMMVAATSILAPLAMATKAFAKQGSALIDMADRTGVSVESLSALEYVASQTGVSLEGIERGIRLSQKAMGSLNGQKSIAKLGLDVGALQKLSPEDQFIAIAGEISKIPSQAERAAAAMTVFGKSGAELLPMLKGGKAGIREMMAEAQKLGVVMSTSDAMAADDLDDSLAALHLQVNRLVASVGGALAPVMKDLSKYLGDIIPRVAGWVRNNKVLIETVAVAAAKVLAFGAAMWAAGKAISFAGSAIGVMRAAIPVLRGVALALVNPWVAIPVAILGVLAVVTGAASEIGRVFGKATQGMADALFSGNIKLAAEILWTSLKLLWAEGTNNLIGLWDGLVAGMDKGLASVQSLFYGKKWGAEVKADIDTQSVKAAEARLKRIQDLENQIAVLNAKAKQERNRPAAEVAKAVSGAGDPGSAVSKVQGVVGSFFANAALSVSAGTETTNFARRTADAAERTADAVEDIADRDYAYGV